MDENAKIAEMIDEEVKYIERHSDFDQNDIREAIESAIRYYRNCGEIETEAWEKARELVATAVYSARTNEFTLAGMVNQMIFSVYHRVQPGCGL